MVPVPKDGFVSWSQFWEQSIAPRWVKSDNDCLTIYIHTYIHTYIHLSNQTIFAQTDFSSATLAKDYQLDDSSMHTYAVENEEQSLSDSILRPLKELDHSSTLNFADRFLGDDGTVKVVSCAIDIASTMSHDNALRITTQSFCSHHILAP